MLLSRDIEMMLKKFIYERFLSNKFGDRVARGGKIILLSQDRIVKSIVDIGKNEIRASFKRSTGQGKRCCSTNIYMQTLIVL